jgi:hypothetical protein
MGESSSVHLLKLCVGIESVDQLTPAGRKKRRRTGPPMVHTRHTPKRAEELLEGGSLYWVIKGAILCRQRIVKITTIEDGAQDRCEIELDHEVINVAPQPKRAFQGWRYLLPKDAPGDLTAVDAGELPTELARELLTLGAW